MGRGTGREPVRVERTARSHLGFPVALWLCLHESFSSALGVGSPASPCPRLSFPPVFLWRSTHGEPAKPELTPEPGEIGQSASFSPESGDLDLRGICLENCSLPLFLAFFHLEFWGLNLKCPEPGRHCHCCHCHCCLSEQTLLHSAAEAVRP